VKFHKILVALFIIFSKFLSFWYRQCTLFLFRRLCFFLFWYRARLYFINSRLKLR
jgi:hypothetical protein